jgi:CRISPR-associated protein Csm4
MTWYVVKLRFTTAVHLGSDEAGIGVENTQVILHSDTIFSALCNAWAKFRILSTKELGELKRLFDDSPPFKLSSGFPYLPKAYGTQFFLPRPLLNTRQFEIFDKDMRPEQKTEWKKQLNQSQFIPSEFFEKWLKSQRFAQEGWLDELRAWDNVVVEDIRPQHAQDRLTMASQLYHLGEMFFEPDPYFDCGLYFIVQFPGDESWKDKLNKGLKSLSDIGLGGERDFGMGRFLCDGVEHGVLVPIDERHPLSFLADSTRQSDKHCVLSLFYPTMSEQQIIQVAIKENVSSDAYQLVRRKGWIFSTSTLLQMKRQTVTMFSEGSVFRIEDFVPQGSIVDLKPNGFPHPVWRFGVALSVPLAES